MFDVRLAEPADLPAVGRVTVAAYQGDGFIDAEDEYVGELGDAAKRAADAEVWVAAEDGEVLGTVTFCRHGTPFAELARPNEGEFRMLAVAQEARRRGVAEALVAKCIERSRDLGYEAIVLCSMREMTTAHRLYERLGFTRLPERDWSPVEGVDLLAYRLRLPVPHPR